MEFSEKLQSLRKGKNLSQEQFAEIMNVSRQAVSKWELGQAYPDIDKLVEISNYFSVSLDCLLKNKEQEQEKAIDRNCDSNQEQEKASDKGCINSEEYISKARIKKVAVAALSGTCLSICLYNLGMLNQVQNTYQAVYLGVLSVVGIIASVYGLIKIKKGSLSISRKLQ